MQKYFATSVTKAWFCLFAIGLLFLLAACGSTPSTANTGNNNPTPTPTIAPTATPTMAPTAIPTTAPTTAPSGGQSVSIATFAFNPGTLTIKAGTTVTWTNKDSVLHTVTDDKGGFNGSLPAGKSFSFTFNTPGTYSYHCARHPYMTAVIIVQ